MKSIMNHHSVPAAAATVISEEAVELQRSAEMLARLERRRSVPMRAFDSAPIPTDDLDQMLRLAARTPDHGRLVPWRFIVVEGDARQKAGERWDTLYLKHNPDLPASKRDMWTLYMLRAPVTVVLVSRTDPTSKIPEWDQMLSAGAAGMSLLVAANSLGYAGQWLLKWPGRNADAASILGVSAFERVAGFIHLGRQTEIPADRIRPDMDTVVSRWRG